MALDILRAITEALKLQESPSQSVIRTGINRALRDESDGTGEFYYIADIFEEDGYCVYSSAGKFYRRDFTMNDDATTSLAPETVEVMPETVYHEVGGQIAESLRERDIPQSVRKMIPGADFAGKNKSFPIQKPEDVAAAARSLGRAGADNYDTETLKRNIMHIAKRKGPAFMAKLPKAWKESQGEVELSGEFIALQERAVADDGTVPVRLIAPGWGTSGYYPVEVLKRDGPVVFHRGTKMLWDHPTAAEEAARPEGSLDRLASELIEDARYESDHPGGPGLYARAKVFEPYRPFVEELAPHIGVSIRAFGTARQGEAEGRKGNIVESIVSARSVDYVTEPGAGGKILQLFESAAGRQQQEEEFMTEQEAKTLMESNTKLQRDLAEIAHKLTLREGTDQIRAKLSQARLPEPSKDVLLVRLAQQIPVKEGALDTPALTALIEAEIAKETAYVASLTGGGQVRGMGNSPDAADFALPKADEIQADLQKSFLAMGMSEAGARIAATGRGRM